MDLTFENAAQDVFFHTLHSIKKIPCSYIFVECKNYTEDVNNPELDQLSGRFSLNKGKFGILMCRTVKDKNLLYKRCKDAYSDDRGLIIPITDNDLIRCLSDIAAGKITINEYLSEMAHLIIMG